MLCSGACAGLSLGPKKTFGPARVAEGRRRPSAGHSRSARNAEPLGIRVRFSGLRFVLLGPTFPSRFLGTVVQDGPFVLAYSGGTAAAFHRLPCARLLFNCRRALYSQSSTCQAISDARPENFGRGPGDANRGSGGAVILRSANMMAGRWGRIWAVWGDFSGRNRPGR